MKVEGVPHAICAYWSAKCRNEDRKRHVELAERYILDNVLELQAEMALVTPVMAVQRMDRENVHLRFLLPPA